MNPPKTILVATDFSAAADRALDHAVALAAALHAKVVLMHAYTRPLPEFPRAVAVASAELTASVKAEARAQLDARIAERSAAGVEIVPLLVRAEPEEGVLDAAEKVAADLIVMGTEGRRGVARAFLGSLATGVARAASVPVMTVRGSVSKG